ncbi:ras-related protein Rab-23-like [Convolutriloba macropyga]|uniref:ras-related protein Rab-23-like n=1 Tax=Convolutriloba macropyga TaxID=536237 RepID=UPI003F5242EF
MEEDDLEIAIKVLVVGNGGVGKSSLIQRYCKGSYTSQYKKTIGVDFLEKSIEVDGQEVRMMLWDTAGQEEFDSITKSYYRGAQCCVLAFSITDRASFDAVDRWREKVVEQCGDKVCMVIVQNKMDLLDQGQHNSEGAQDGGPLDTSNYVTPQEGEDLAKRLKMRLHRISVKNNEGVHPVFEHLCGKYLASLKKMKQEMQQVSSSGAASSDMIGMFSTSISQDTATSSNTNGNTKNNSKGSKTKGDDDEERNDAINARTGTINLKPSRQRTGKGKDKKKKMGGCSLI